MPVVQPHYLNMWAININAKYVGNYINKTGSKKSENVKSCAQKGLAAVAPFYAL